MLIRHFPMDYLTFDDNVNIYERSGKVNIVYIITEL